MSDEEEIDLPTFDSNNSQQVSDVERANLTLKLLPKGKIQVDWTNFPRHPQCQRFLVHYRSLNSNQSEAIPVSRGKTRFILQRFPIGHLYEFHVCSVDRSNQILAMSEIRRIQSLPIDEAPTLFIAKSTGDSICLQWNKSSAVRTSQIQSFKLTINGETKAIFPADESQFVFNHGQLGKQYVFQLEMIRKDGRMIASLPIVFKWPAVTLPKREVVVNGNDEIIITWQDSLSINNAQIESFTIYLYDSSGNLCKRLGPFPSESRQLWIKDLKPDIYYYNLEIQLSNSKRSLRTKTERIQCGEQSLAPHLSYELLDAKYQQDLINITYELIRYHDTLKSNRLREKSDQLLQEYLRTMADVTEVLRLNLIIEPRLEQNPPPNFSLSIDGREKVSSIPWFIRQFPLELSRRERPYELIVSLVPDNNGITSNKIQVEASGHFSFFCAHFNQHASNYTCSYLETFLGEKQFQRTIHQGHLKLPQTMKRVQLYDMKNNRIVDFPSPRNSSRLTFVLFFVKQCIPSMLHLNYFSTYAASHSHQFNYIAVNCNPNDLDEVQKMVDDFQSVEFYSDFSQDQFEYEMKDNETPIHRLLSIHGVPTYSVLDFYGQIVWKGRLCVRDQEGFDRTVDQITAEVSQVSESIDDQSQNSAVSSIHDQEIENQLNYMERLLQSIIEKRSIESMEAKQAKRSNQRRHIVSIKHN